MGRREQGPSGPWFRLCSDGGFSRGLFANLGQKVIAKLNRLSQSPKSVGAGEAVDYSLWMEQYEPFDLPEFMLSHFNRVDFGGNLFEQWPVGIRFEIGIKQVSRATRIYDLAFAQATECVLVSQDWSTDGSLAKRYTPFFMTPGVFPSQPSHFQTAEVTPFDESSYRLTWTRLAPLAFNAAKMFQAIANREQPGNPKIASGVYVIDPGSKIIMHMYDDRGLDIIAAKLSSLRPLFETFRDWILDIQRHRVEFRFATDSQELPEQRP